MKKIGDQKKEQLEKNFSNQDSYETEENLRSWLTTGVVLLVLVLLLVKILID
ncbi:MAG: hypothetical protein P8J93_08975 [SAR86 cluster bacterium]|jgi:hypothetical protein|nr:hypothetical protein [SAR86 cluster bacterium]|tara:strand:- start:3746 stop:3901 length:156 start_codon:yes stop_codon:yes gene_type:complete